MPKRFIVALITVVLALSAFGCASISTVKPALAYANVDPMSTSVFAGTSAPLPVNYSRSTPVSNKNQGQSTSKNTSSNSTNPWKEYVTKHQAWINSLGGKALEATTQLRYTDAGKTCWVYGQVVNVYTAKNSKGSPTFIDFGFRNSKTPFFTAIIWEENRGNFPDNLNSLVGKEVAVHGTVYLYMNWYKQMEITDESQISVYQG